MGSVLQEGVVPDGQGDVEHPLATKDHIKVPADIQDLIPGPSRLHRACRNIQGCEGHGNLSEGATLTQEMERQEAALRPTLDTLLLSSVKTKKPVDVVTVLDVENDLGAKDEQNEGEAGGNGHMDHLISDSELGSSGQLYLWH